MCSLVESMFEKASQDVKTIVLPEGDDPRTLEAAEIILERGFANLVIIGNEADIASSPDKQRYADAFYELRKNKGVSEEDALAKMDDVLYFGTMMVKLGDADGMVAGACHSTSDVLRSALQVLKTAPGTNYVSSFFIMEVPDCDLGDKGRFFFADCGLNVQPTPEMLAETAVCTAKNWESFIGTEARVALLSHSTKGSAAQTPDRDKVIDAVALAHEMNPDVALDGELQLDAAIIPEIGQSKAPDSPIAGHANVLIFPDLDAGNIGYKLVQRLARAEAYGPITQGLAAPVNDLSRGCNADDIAGVVAITCVQAQAQ